MRGDKLEDKGRERKPWNIKDHKKIMALIFAAVGALMICVGGFISFDEKPAEEYTDLGFYTDYLEKRIKELCVSVEGITDATVFLTLDCSSEYLYQENGASDFLIISGRNGEEAVKLCEIYPKVRGIAVVCTGGDIPRIKETVTELLSAALGLPYNKIKVAGS